MTLHAASPAPRARPAGDCRCACGSLLARVVESGVELKCRRCKRTLLVPLPASARRGIPTPVEPIPVPEAADRLPDPLPRPEVPHPEPSSPARLPARGDARTRCRSPRDA